jgi:malate dehydrogenase (oxaloacetate-decarboxylating)
LTSIKGNLQTIIDKADVFIGVSAAGALKGEWIKSMNPKSIIFALANPTPEIFPD